jgi:uracil-DNA glycosylase
VSATPPQVDRRTPRRSLLALELAAEGCTACPLHRDATQTVFGEGASRARLMLIGEQPGDQEDLAGRPFVGPAGRLLDDALGAAGIDRSRAYVTNVVKHFKYERSGERKVRIHKKPTRGEVEACRPWLDRELEVVRPQVVVLLGATAAQAVLGSSFRLTQHRGEWLHWERPGLLTATVHPSSVLRSRHRRQARDDLVADLRFVADELGV